MKTKAFLDFIKFLDVIIKMHKFVDAKMTVNNKKH